VTWIQTFEGREFDLVNPGPDMVSAEDIAHALSQLCRYNGHTHRFYSVAEHSVLVSDWLASQGHRPGIVLAGLLHDAHEAYVSDLPAPLKRMMDGAARAWWEALVARLDVVIGEWAGLPREALLHAVHVREADARILLDERAALLGPAPRSWGPVEDLEPLGVGVIGLPPWQARARFLERLYRLAPHVEE